MRQYALKLEQKPIDSFAALNTSTLSYEMKIICESGRNYHNGHYLTKENAEIACEFARNVIAQNLPQQQTWQELEKLETMADIRLGVRKTQITDLQKDEYIQYASWRDNLNVYQTRFYVKSTGRELSIGNYQADEVQVMKNRLMYLKRLEGRYITKHIETAAGIFRAMQRQESIPFETTELRLNISKKRMLCICVTPEDGRLMETICDKIDTILPSDYNMLTEDDIADYNHILIFNLDGHPYGRPKGLPNIDAKPKSKESHIIKIIRGPKTELR